MRKTILITTLAVLLGTVALYAEQNYFNTPFGETFGYSSEDSGGTSYLGVDTRDVSADRLGALNLKEEKGVEVTMVDQDAPAGKAGIKEHDVIMSVNGQEVESVEQLRRLIREVPAGRVVTLGISRAGQPLTLKAQLADRKKAFAYAFGPDAKAFKFDMTAVPPVPPMPPMQDLEFNMPVVIVQSSARSGLLVENLTPQLGDFFGAKNGQGVLVRSVEKGSRAEKAGFHAGDVIVKVNGTPVNDAGDFSHAVRSRKENTVNVSIIRDKKEQTISLALPDRKQSEIFEESFDMPDVDMDVRIDLSELDAEMAKVRPQIALVQKQARKLSSEATKEATEQARKAMADQKAKIILQGEEMKEQQKELLKQWKEQFKEFRGSKGDI